MIRIIFSFPPSCYPAPFWYYIVALLSWLAWIVFLYTDLFIIIIIRKGLYFLLRLRKLTSLPCLVFLVSHWSKPRLTGRSANQLFGRQTLCDDVQLSRLCSSSSVTLSCATAHDTSNWEIQTVRGFKVCIMADEKIVASWRYIGF